MVLPDLPPGMMLGLAFGILGISFWIIGLVIFERLFARMDKKANEAEP